ncbi:MAG TPA: response regulator [Stellaceae bacterium]|nr:response regulator [Stellaceae bacterium]
MPRILLVDDDIAVRLVFLEILFDAGYEVDTAHSFEAGNAILETGHAFDLLITDGGFSDGTGAALADRADARGIPVLIVTGNPLALGRAKYPVLAKPMRATALLSAVDEVLKAGPR